MTLGWKLLVAFWLAVLLLVDMAAVTGDRKLRSHFITKSNFVAMKILDD